MFVIFYVLIIALSLYLLWFFITLYAKVYQLISINIGKGSAIIFIVSILFFCCNRQYEDAPAANAAYVGTTIYKKGTPGIKYKQVSRKLVDNNVYRIYLDISYAQRDSSYKMIPVSANCRFNGWSINNKWATTKIELTPSKDSSFLQYGVAGTMRWSFFGTPVMTNTHYFYGIVEYFDPADQVF